MTPAVNCQCRHLRLQSQLRLYSGTPHPQRQWKEILPRIPRFDISDTGHICIDTHQFRYGIDLSPRLVHFTPHYAIQVAGHHSAHLISARDVDRHRPNLCSRDVANHRLASHREPRGLRRRLSVMEMPFITCKSTGTNETPTNAHCRNDMNRKRVTVDDVVARLVDGINTSGAKDSA